MYLNSGDILYVAYELIQHRGVIIRFEGIDIYTVTLQGNQLSILYMVACAPVIQLFFNCQVRLYIKLY